MLVKNCARVGLECSVVSRVKHVSVQGEKCMGEGWLCHFFFGLGAAHSGIGIACETGQSREHEHPSMLISAAVKLIKTGCSGFGFYISFTSIWWEMVSQLSIRFGLGS